MLPVLTIQFEELAKPSGVVSPPYQQTDAVLLTPVLNLNRA